MCGWFDCDVRKKMSNPLINKKNGNLQSKHSFFSLHVHSQFSHMAGCVRFIELKLATARSSVFRNTRQIQRIERELQKAQLQTKNSSPMSSSSSDESSSRIPDVSMNHLIRKLEHILAKKTFHSMQQPLSISRPKN
jgi:hypothetical protein